MAATEMGQETMAVDLGELLDAGDNATVTLLAGETQLVVHRAVLADRSPVFAAMFRHDMLEASSGQVSIPDMEGPVLRLLLAFMYSLRVPQLPSMAPELLVAADKYGVPALKAACERQVAAQLSMETAAATAVLAVRHCCDSLRKEVINFIKEDWAQVMASQGWADAIRTQPEDVVEVHRLLAEQPAESSAPAVADSMSTPAASPSSRPHSGFSQTAAAAPHLVAKDVPPPDDEAVSRLWSLSGDEKAGRLIRAAQQGNVRELRALLVAGADVAARDGCGFNALDHAVFCGHAEVVRSLLSSGADVAARDPEQRTPLHYAAWYGHAAVVRLLAESNTDPNPRDKDGRTPLHDAAQRGHAEVASVLLEAGATRGATCDEGCTPLFLAWQRGHEQVADILT